MSPFSEGTRSYGGPVTRRGPRVLLFVQNEGDKRPKVAARWRNTVVERAVNNIEWARANDLTGVAVTGPLRAVAAADRWWLIECENAEAGRKAIKQSGFMDYSHGRVLASGGKR